jgi:uncharacterized protein YjbI with pentapeptide repeats
MAAVDLEAMNLKAVNWQAVNLEEVNLKAVNLEELDREACAMEDRKSIHWFSRNWENVENSMCKSIYHPRYSWYESQSDV